MSKKFITLSDSAGRLIFGESVQSENSIAIKNPIILVVTEISKGQYNSSLFPFFFPSFFQNGGKGLVAYFPPESSIMTNAEMLSEQVMRAYISLFPEEFTSSFPKIEMMDGPSPENDNPDSGFQKIQLFE